MKTALQIFQDHKDPISKTSKMSASELFEKVQADKKKAPSKYKSKRVVIQGINFDSTGEGNYFLELQSRHESGEFKEMKRQVYFDFIVNGIRVGRYKADFVLLHYNGCIDVLDYKSRFTASLALYKLKKELMLACYGIVIKEVGLK